MSNEERILASGSACVIGKVRVTATKIAKKYKELI